jgi:hypothetical protein
MDLVNLTPFAVDRHLFLDGGGREQLLVVVKATWSIANGTPKVAEEQLAVAVADEYRGEPGASSLLGACDLIPGKPGTDVLIEGFAYGTSPGRTEALVAIQVGALRKGFRVVGDRVGNAFGASAPRPFEKMEITWERAFGGTDASVPGKLDLFEENPVGVGFRARGSRLPSSGAPLPNIEAIDAPAEAVGKRIPAVGVGPVAPHWKSRTRHAGTYDARWRKERFPFLPVDFDPRYYQVAPPDQVLPGYLKGGERVRIAGMTPDAPIAFSIPFLAPQVAIEIGDDEEAAPAGQCDTVLVDTDRKEVTLTWRTLVDVHGRVPRVRSIRVEAGVSHVG